MAEFRGKQIMLLGLKGDKGDKVEIQSTSTHIQYRYVDSDNNPTSEWQNMIAISELKGADGQDGQDGAAGQDGRNGADGVSITDVQAGVPSTSGNTTTTPITFTFSNGEQKRVNVVAQKGDTGAAGQDGADGDSGVNNVISGQYVYQDSNTVTPVTFNFENGNSKTVNVFAKNGEKGEAGAGLSLISEGANVLAGVEIDQNKQYWLAFNCTYQSDNEGSGKLFAPLSFKEIDTTQSGEITTTDYKFGLQHSFPIYDESRDNNKLIIGERTITARVSLLKVFWDNPEVTNTNRYTIQQSGQCFVETKIFSTGETTLDTNSGASVYIEPIGLYVMDEVGALGEEVQDLKTLIGDIMSLVDEINGEVI